MLQKQLMPKELTLGGQAVIEGVLMKSKKSIAIAVRKPNKKIVVKKEKQVSLIHKYPILNFPIIRGVIILIEMLIFGTKALIYSANQQEEEHEAITTKELVITFILSIIAVLVFFLGLPFLLTKLIVNETGTAFNIIDGIFRALIFILYVYAISFMKDIRRAFEYHGAEHMAVHCYEAKKALTVKNIKKFPPEHPRCGTAFLVLVIIISIIVFSAIRDPRLYVNFLLRIPLLPLIAGISYEILKIGGRFPNNPVMRIIIKPGIWVQYITTKKPDKSQIEVAIAALKGVLKN